jgi:hypothetical protein
MANRQLRKKMERCEIEILAIWENGVLRPVAPLKLIHSLVKIQVPDEAVASTEEMENSGAPGDVMAIGQKPPLDELLSEHPDDPWLKRMKEVEARILTIPEDQLPELTEKQLERIVAFGNREDR